MTMTIKNAFCWDILVPVYQAAAHTPEESNFECQTQFVFNQRFENQLHHYSDVPRNESRF
jgi:hypothetical protein